MSDQPTQPSFWQEMGQAFAVGATLTAAAWGAFGGATAALAIEVDRKAVIRQIMLGGMVSAGVGALAMAFIVLFWKLPPELIPAGAGVGGAHFLVGVFGPALIERILRRLQPDDDAEPPNEGEGAS